MSAKERSWQALEQQHRMEELWEAYAVRAAVSSGGTSVFPEGFFEGIRDDLKSAGSELGLALSSDGSTGTLHVEAEDAGGFALLEEKLISWMEVLKEAYPERFLPAPARRVAFPAGGTLPDSEAYLERLYAGDFVPREKKPQVIDLSRSRGPFLASIDEEPLVFMDAMSQIATLPAGFGPSEVQLAIDEGFFDDALVNGGSHSKASQTARATLEVELRKHLPEALHNFAYANSGAEGNEKAICLARLFGPGGKRMIAFEGSFHGRTLLSLYGTWNKAKREPYQIEGYEVDFVPFPATRQPRNPAPFDAEWISAWENARSSEPTWESEDALVQAEVESLLGVRSLLEAGDTCAVWVEPMQSEGGDNHGTSRFFNGLRALTRAYRVPLIIDEVQTGFGLGGPFFWHSAFEMRRSDGKPDHPDLVICAKKAQLGVVASAWPDPLTTDSHGVSALRGAIHAKIAGEQYPHVDEIEEAADTHLSELQAEMPDGLVVDGRATGYAFAFDLPSAEIADKLVAQRFYRGAMVYKAGANTLRYRLNSSFDLQRTADVFQVIRTSLNAVIEWAGGVGDGGEDLFERMGAVEVPSWVDGEGKSSRRNGSPVTVRRLRREEWDEVSARVMVIEEASYEPERRDTEAFLRGIAEAPESVVLMAEKDDEIVGFTFGAPLERFSAVRGPHKDSFLGSNNTFYSADVTVHPDHRGGVGGALKAAQVREVLQARDENGVPRFTFITGRNRVGHTVEMGSINARFGAYAAKIFRGEYGTEDGQAIYYRIPLRRTRRTGKPSVAERSLDVAHGITQPLGPNAEILCRARDLGRFDTALLTKLTLSNFTTRNWIRYLETLRAMAPESCGHLYVTSCRDEMTDKALRCVRYHRKEGAVVIGFEGGYFGHTTAASRSMTDWKGHPDAARLGWFDWPKIAHPGNPSWGEGEKGAEEMAKIYATSASDLDAVQARRESAISAVKNVDGKAQGQVRQEAETLAAIEETIVSEGAERILCVMAEVIQERTGATLSHRFWSALSAMCGTYDIPVVLDETASGAFRSGHGLWRSDTLPVQPDAVLWYAGGQQGHLFVSDRYFIAKPLQLISTWDGDEVSGIRNMWTLRALRQADVAGTVSQLQGVMDRIWSGLELEGRLGRYGEGGYVAIDAPLGKGEAFVSALEMSGLEVGVGFGDRILLAPPMMGWSEEDWSRLENGLRSALSNLVPRANN